MSEDMDCQSERIAAMPCASWRRRSSQSFAPPASSGYCRWNASKSGSPPSMRSFRARLRSRIICRVRSSCSGVRFRSESLLRDLLHALAQLLVRRLCVAPPLEALALEALHLLELLLQLVEHLGEI